MQIGITGARGQLGTELIRAAKEAGYTVHSLVRPTFDLAELDRVPSLDADVIVHAAAWTDVDGCARDPERAMLINGTAAGMLAQLCEQAGARFIHISTNEVFEGMPGRTYSEFDELRPVNAYGASKALGERTVREAAPSATIVRTAWVYGGPRSFPAKIREAALRASGDGRKLAVVTDEIGNPTPAALLADRIVSLVGHSGTLPPVIHLAGDPPLSRYQWATEIVQQIGLPPPEPIAMRDYRRASTPPLHAVLDTSLSQGLGLGIAWRDAPG